MASPPARAACPRPGRWSARPAAAGCRCAAAPARLETLKPRNPGWHRLQRAQRVHVQVVGRLVQQQQVAAAPQHLRARTAMSAHTGRAFQPASKSIRSEEVDHLCPRPGRRSFTQHSKKLQLFWSVSAPKRAAGTKSCRMPEKDSSRQLAHCTTASMPQAWQAQSLLPSVCTRGMQAPTAGQVPGFPITSKAGPAPAPA